MTSETFRERAERERKAHDEGLTDRPYLRVLHQSRYWFWKRRRELGAEIIRSYALPRVIELGACDWRGYIEDHDLVVDDLTCINVSEVELEKGVEMARTTRNKPKFELGDAHDLKYDDHSFDVVFGGSILHHLDLERALKEIRRILKPDGTMFFFEPLDMNPVGRLVRHLTPKARTDDERPFRMKDIRLIDRYFDCSYQFQEMISVPVGALSALAGASTENPAGRAAYAFDRAIGRMPGLKFWCRTVFFHGKPKR